MALSKEQQVLADRVAATLEHMRHASADRRCPQIVELLEAAALDVLDASQTAEDTRGIRELLAKAEEMLSTK